MSRIEWSAGPHHAFVHDDVLLLIAGDLMHGDLVEVWDRLVGADVTGLGTVLELLSDVTGAALSSLPDFAMAVLDDKGLHVASRGRCHVQVTHEDGSVLDLRGDEVSTWLERNVDALTTAHVALGARTDGAAWLPLDGGVVPAGGVRLVLADVPVPVAPVATTPAPAPPVARSTAETLAEVEPDNEPDEEPGDEPGDEPDELPEDREELPRIDVEEPPSRFAQMFSPHTVIHDIEDAAVRAVDADEVPPEEREPRPDPVPVRAAEAPSPDGPAESTPAAVTPAQAAVPEPTPPVASPPSFISGVPSAAPPATPVVPAGPAVSPEDDGEHHDGHTLLEAPDSTEIDAYLAADVSAPGQETVLGVLCASGHANPTHRTACRVCGERLSGEGVRMARPGLGWLLTSAGEQIELVQNVLAGRNPQASRIQGPVLPRLLPLPHSHVSGTHLEIRLEGWSVMVVDLDSTNGTFLQRPGQPTVRISRSPQLLTSDDVVQLGHGVDLRFEALP